METWRCPTCLAVLLEHSASRCPTCHSRLRRRGRPIVLGETSRLDVQATQSIDQPVRTARERGHWNTEVPAQLFERRSRRRGIDLNPEPVDAPVVAPEYGPVPCAWFDAQAEPEITEPEVIEVANVPSVLQFEPAAAPVVTRRPRWSFTPERRGRDN